MKYLALIFDGFEEEEAMAPFALIRRAGGNLTIASNKETVIGSHNIALTNITLLDKIDYKDYDVLIIPGGAHYKYLRESKLVHEIILDFNSKNKFIATICAAPTILGMLGLLKNKNYTCFTSMNQDFGGHYFDKGVVVDGNLITSRSVAYSHEFAYKIIELTLGKDTLNKVHIQTYYEK